MSATTLTDRAVIRLSGEDVRGFLNGLVTQELSGPLPVWAGLLTPQGKCLFDFLVWADGDDLLLDCEADAADDLIKRLAIYRLRRPIRIEREYGLAVRWSPDGAEGVPDPRLAALGSRWLTNQTPTTTGLQAGEAVESLESLRTTGVPAREHKWLERRLRLGVCEGRSELGDLLWLECNAAELNGVSFTKGCFIGQENTARMNWRSKVNRRLVVVEASAPGSRTRAFYPSLGLAVEHRRADDLEGAIMPAWLRQAVTA